ncbi:unnamed protein product [Urochloa humidicola]
MRPDCFISAIIAKNLLGREQSYKFLLPGNPQQSSAQEIHGKGMLGSTWLRMFYKQYTSSTHTEALAGIKVHIEHGMMQIIFETNSTKLNL